MDKYEINKVLIDPRFGVKVIFIYVIQHIGILIKDLMPTKMPIAGFDDPELLTIR